MLARHVSSEADVRASLPRPVRSQLGAALSIGSVTANPATGIDNAAYATANRPGMETVGPNEDLTGSAGVNHTFQIDPITATAEAAWKANKGVNFALSARHAPRGDSRIGAGVRICF